MILPQNAPCALVVGLCSHGLAIARSLQRLGIEVHAFEANSSIPGALTNSAHIHYVKSIKDNSLVDDLRAFRERIPLSRDIVLFPSNDNNVRVIARNIDRLRGAYILSWESCVDQVQKLLLKSNIEDRCKETGLNYPASVVLENRGDLKHQVSSLKPPFIIKPANPQSGFKAIKCTSVTELEAVVDHYPGDYPFVVQEWVSGTDKDLYFCALYLDNGLPLISFEGNKLASFPPALGQTTVAVSVEMPELRDLTKLFFDGLGLCGPVSLEFKRDAAGRYWVIEPTVGRTDFWVGLCIRAGCDLPAIEYLSSTGQTVPVSTGDYTPTIWFDSERDAFGPVKYLPRFVSGRGKVKRPVFSFFSRRDLKPFLRCSRKAFYRMAHSLARRMVEKPNETPSEMEVSSYPRIDLLPEAFLCLLEEKEQDSIFLGRDWFDNFSATVATGAGDVFFLCLAGNDGRALAVLPMWRNEGRFHGVKVRKLTGLSNYYSPIFDVIFDPSLITREYAYGFFLKYLWKEIQGWDLVDFYPVSSETRDDILKVSGIRSLRFDYFLTKNFFHDSCENYEDYISSRPSRVVNTVKRKFKKLDAVGGWSVCIYTELDAIESKLKDYHRVYEKSWKNDEPYPEFINGFARMCARKGRLRLGVLDIDGKAIAVQLWVVANRTACIYKLAYDKAYKNLSPGTVLTAKMIEQVIKVDNIEKIDFLTGLDFFKKEWMDRSRCLYGVQIVNYRSLSGMLVLLINELSKIKKHFTRIRNVSENLNRV
ncbi:GNAT family N-acetyltransferase [Marinobacterium sedimentorum]|uniref:GNAT family N-acetyltransferase n=1 Tax=Marinobacterium sedimentorum TaxID=2927804 RepID=UPI0020C71E3F|nr:GNAT family N-acetyltransferase [Marinobacterium sedimentorum]MCP8686784.1 GNAT family N-acetyltransferase [Marinobacterium sedimentorum]